MLRRHFYKFTLVLSVALSVAGGSNAETLHLDIVISDVRNGSQAWDPAEDATTALCELYTGLLQLPEMIGDPVCKGGSWVGRHWSAPDPRLCFLETGLGLQINGLSCESNAEGRVNGPMRENTLHMQVALNPRIADGFGVGVYAGRFIIPIMIQDFDEIHHDIIGWGILIDEVTYSEIRSKDNALRLRAIEWIERVERSAISYMKAHGVINNRKNAWGTGGVKNVAKLALSRCRSGCQIGDATIRISTRSSKDW